MFYSFFQVSQFVGVYKGLTYDELIHFPHTLHHIISKMIKDAYLHNKCEFEFKT
jgi:hypothetical protein